MLVFIFKSTACLLAFLLFYKLVLEREKMHRFNRFYLLTALVLSFGIPLVTFTTVVEVQPLVALSEEFEPFTLTQSQEDFIEEPSNRVHLILGGIYGLGFTIFLILFIKNSVQMYFKISYNEKRENENTVLVLLKKRTIPHTFLKYIFLEKKAIENNEIPEAVLLHEEAHAVQKHSLDVLFVEILQIIFWFNPLIYLAKHRIKLNHEFLADDAVLHHGVSTTDYGKILLDYSQPNFKNKSLSIGMANSINYSSFKKRFTVMKKNTSKKSVWLRSLFFLPLVAALIYGFSNKETVEVVVQSNQNEVTEQVVPQNTEEGATEKMMQEYNDYIQKYQSVKKRILKISEYNRIKDIYDLMTAEQKTSVVDHNTLFRAVNFDFSAPKRKKPSQAEFNSWKNSKKFAIWIDSKHVPNSELDNYSVDDIVYYSGSFVYKNARSKNFPQEYQFHLSTKQGFENTYLKSGFNKYEALRKTYNSERKAFLNSGSKDNSELRLLHYRLWKMYKKFTPKEIEKYKITTPEPYPNYKLEAEERAEEDSKNIQVAEDIQIYVFAENAIFVNKQLSTLKELPESLKVFNKHLSKVERENMVQVDLIITPETSKKVLTRVKTVLKNYGARRVNLTSQKYDKEKSEQITADIKENLKRVNTLKVNYTDENGNIIKNQATELSQSEAKPKLIIKEDNTWWLNDKKTSLKTIKKDFINIVGKRKSSLHLTSVHPISRQEIYEIHTAIGEQIISIDTAVKETKVYDEITPPHPPAPKATAKQVAEYNAWAKSINEQMAKAKVNNDINEYPIVKIKLVNKYKAIYKIMSEAQKKASEPWPSFPPPPPPAPKVKKGEKSNIPPPPPPPVKATPKQLAEYNTLAKKYNAQPINERVVKLKDLKKLEYVYGKMSLKQKENAQPFPECPPPPPSPVVQKGEKSNIPPPPPPAMDIMYTYNSLAKRTKFIPNNRKNNIQHLKVLFNKMSDSQKEKVESPSSISNHISQLNNLSAAQVEKVNKVLNKIKAKAQSKGRKFYTAAEYKELEELYAGMLNN